MNINDNYTYLVLITIVFLIKPTLLIVVTVYHFLWSVIPQVLTFMSHEVSPRCVNYKVNLETIFSPRIMGVHTISVSELIHHLQ